MLARMLTSRSLTRSACLPALPRFSRPTGGVSVRALYTGDANGSGLQPGVAQPAVQAPGPVFNSWTVYKGKGAMAVKAIPPAFVATAGRGLKLDREGTLLLEFAHATAEQVYDWKEKISFALSAVEVATLMELGPEGASFFHDPNKMTPEEGNITKTLRISRAPDGKAWFFNFTQSGRAGKPFVLQVPVSNAELTVLKSLGNYLIPHLLGFHAAMAGM